ncbi:interleukin-4-like [Scyliorhinus canicula]|uniref:interleukin-4-like n=1 Tax=Scyliorhinus canicula TaxID=7830 RepID=UPI0018F436F9|nr:interleukin-4-like [Scyliorhinus canicula]
MIMSQVLKAVILLFILASVKCKLQTALQEVIHDTSKENVKKISCGDDMIHHVDFKMHKCANVSEVFCKAAKALGNIIHHHNCQNSTIFRIYVLTTTIDQNANCTVNEDEEVDLKTFLSGLRVFSRFVMRHNCTL